jgi:acyl-CoA synthetase (AMP-forming)/AMP-acid ligase II
MNDTAIPAAFTLWQLFVAAAADNADREAVVDPANRESLCPGTIKRWNYSELQTQALKTAQVLSDCGVTVGSVVLVQLPNIAELVAVYLAVARLGAIISPVPMQYRQHEISGISAEIKPLVFIGIDRFKSEAVAVGQSGALPATTIKLSLGGAAPVGFEDLSARVDAAEPMRAPVTAISAEQTYTICWTSGTTGSPKGVPRSHAHWLAMLPAFEDATALPRHATFLAPFPMVNMAAISVFLVYWLSVQGRLVLHHPLELPVFLQQIAEEKVEYTVAPPALLTMLLAQPELMARYDISSLRVIGSGSAPLSPEMIKGFKSKLNVDIVNMFGSNEGCCLVSDAKDVPDPADRAIYFPRFGQPNLRWHNRMGSMLLTKLVDPATGALINEAGQPGELLIKGPTVFAGYLNSDVERATVFDSEGFFRTGDLFEIAGKQNQFYKFVGRHKDIIIRGGMKISPEELDLLLMSHPAIADAATAAFPDEHLGQRIAAFVCLKQGQNLTLGGLCDFLSARGLARFKLPERLEIVDALPRNPLGKVVRRQLEKSIA